MASLDIPRHRLHNQQIAQTQFRTPAQVVACLGAVQAQDYAGAKWSLGLRLPAATDADIEKAIAAASIIRTWPMRGTLHFVAAADIHWMLGLLAPRIITGLALRHRQLELDDAAFRLSRRVLSKALRGGQHLTREELAAAYARAGLATGGQRLYHLLARAALEGLICFGVPRGNQQTFTLLGEWAPEKKPLDRADALATLARRYFTSHGPASLKDFVAWTGLAASDARAGLEAAAPQLTAEKIEGEPYWFPPHAETLPRRPAAVYALPGFDEYVLGYRDRRAVLDPKFANRVCPGGNGVFYPTIVLGGQIVGTWKRTLKKEVIEIGASPFTLLTPAQTRAFAKAARRYGEFLGMPVAFPQT